MAKKVQRALSLVWDQWNEIICNNSHHVPVQREFLDSLCTGIDQSKSMFLSSRELKFRQACMAVTGGLIARIECRAIEIVPSIDKVIERERWLRCISGVAK